MGRAPRNPGPEVPAPSVERADDAGSRRDALWLLSGQVHDITADLSKLLAKTDRLIADVAENSKEIRQVRSSLTLVTGFGLCAILLVPACAGLLWWFVGARMTEFRDQLIPARQPPAASSPAPAAK